MSPLQYTARLDTLTAPDAARCRPAIMHEEVNQRDTSSTDLLPDARRLEASSPLLAPRVSPSARRTAAVADSLPSALEGVFSSCTQARCSMAPHRLVLQVARCESPQRLDDGMRMQNPDGSRVMSASTGLHMTCPTRRNRQRRADLGRSPSTCKPSTRNAPAMVFHAFSHRQWVAAVGRGDP